MNVFKEKKNTTGAFQVKRATTQKKKKKNLVVKLESKNFC